MGKSLKISEVEKTLLERLSKEYELPQGMLMVIIPSEKYEERKLESGFVEKTGVEELNKHQLKMANDQREKFETEYFMKADDLLVAVTYVDEEGKKLFCKEGDLVALNSHANIQSFKVSLDYINESGLKSENVTVGVIRAYDVLLKKKR